MIEIHQALREKFLGFGRTEFADWLGNGLNDYYQYGTGPKRNPDRTRAFGAMHGEIVSQETIFEGIARIYESQVPQSGKLAFRQAIGDVLGESNPEKAVSPEATLDLIYLIGRIEARESLKSFTGVIKRSDVDVNEILYTMIANLALLSPSKEAYQTTEELVGSSQFDDGYLPETLTILTECKPSETVSLLNTYLSRLNKLKNECQKSGAQEWNTFVEGTEKFSEKVLQITRDDKEKVGKILTNLATIKQ